MDKEIQENLNYFNPATIDWHKYNLAKTQEKMWFYKLLYELSLIIPQEPYRTGRPPIPVRSLFFCAGLKLYSNYSSRKVSSDLKTAKLAGFIEKNPHFNTLNDFLNCKETYDLLKRLLTISAMPLSEIETEFSLDSTGFASYQFDRWSKVKYGVVSNNWTKRRNFLKGHVSIGTKTNVICSCKITDGYDSDVKQAPELLRTLGDNFNVKEVSADGAYSSKRIHQIVESLGAIPFIPFSPARNPNKKSPEIWLRMFRYFHSHKEWFMNHYHRRSNVETTFSMIKLKFGEHLKCKSAVSKRNELMMKFICHNICCLVSEIFENNVNINFGKCLKRYIERKENIEEKEKVLGQE